MRTVLIVGLTILFHQAQAQHISESNTIGGSPGAGYRIDAAKKIANQTFYWLTLGCDTLFQNKIPLSFKSTVPEHDFLWTNPNGAAFIILDSLHNVQINLQFSATDHIISYDAQQTADGDFLLTYTISNDSLYLNEQLFIVDSTLKHGGLCLSKVSPDGEVIFTKCFPANGIGRAFIGQLPGGNVVLAGHVAHGLTFDSIVLPCIGCHAEDSDIFIALLDSIGNTLDARRLGGFNFDYLWDMEISPENDIFLTGSFYSKDFYYDTLYLKSHLFWVSKDAFLLKVDAALNPVWIKQAGSVNFEDGKSIEFDAEGNIYWGGYFCCSKVSFDGDTVWGGFTNSFVRKITDDGQALWTKVFISGDGHNLFDLARSENGTIWAAIQYQDSLVLDHISTPSLGDNDAALVQLDGDGDILRYFTVGSAGFEKISHIQVLNDHQLFVSGAAVLQAGDSLQFLNMTLHPWSNHTGPDFSFVLNLPVVETVSPVSSLHPVLANPNPVRSGRLIRVNPMTETTGIITLFDAAGRTVYTQKAAEGSTIFEIPAPMHSGVFFLHFQTKKWQFTQKIVVVD